MSDESTRRQVMDGLSARIVGKRRMAGLTVEQCLGLLASVDFGRIVFTRHALPVIQPVNHLIDDGHIVVRTRLAASIATTVTAATGDIVVAYQADRLDPVERLGWSVVATGIARPISDPARKAFYEQLLDPWVDPDMDTMIAIRPQILAGFRLTAT